MLTVSTDDMADHELLLLGEPKEPAIIGKTVRVLACFKII